MFLAGFKRLELSKKDSFSFRCDCRISRKGLGVSSVMPLSVVEQSVPSSPGALETVCSSAGNAEAAPIWFSGEVAPMMSFKGYLYSSSRACSLPSHPRQADLYES